MNKILLIFCIFSFACSYANLVQDDFVNEYFKNSEVKMPKAHLDYDYSSTKSLKIKLNAVNKIKSEKDVYEGQTVEFRVLGNVYNGKQLIIRQGAKAVAKVKYVTSPGMNGIPASIVFGDFKIDGISDNNLIQDYEIFGQDRSLLVFPLKWALTVLPPTGSLTNFIRGGHAKLKTTKDIVLTYYPDWK